MPKRTILSITLIVSLVLLLVALAVLQYRWSGQVSEAEHERMHTSLLVSINQFRLQFNNEFQQLGLLFQPDTTILMNKDWKNYAGSCVALLNGSDAYLIRNIYLWIASTNNGSQLLRLNRNMKAFEIVSWPSGLETVRNQYIQVFSNPPRFAPELRPFTWTVLFRIPLLLHPLVTFQLPPDSRGASGKLIGFLMMELNLEAMRVELFPELARKYFGSPDGFIYQVAVVSGHDSGGIIFQSDPNLTPASFARPDAKISLLENPRERFGPRRGPNPERGGGSQAQANSRPPMMPFGPKPPPQTSERNMEPVLFDSDGVNLELVAKHREGSLEAAVAGLRRRNLAISFGSLLLLAVSMALILVSARRAQWLARLQIDFVAGVSHELRTPLAVICSAGDNLAEGVIADSSQPVKKYGELIRNQGRKLTAMVDQIMQFASMQRGRRHYSLRPAHINEAANAALEQAQPMIAAAGFSVEKSFVPDLPLVNVDAAALIQAVQNLIQNALKYSGESRWLAVRTGKVHTKHSTEIQLIIEDRGMGIEGEDLQHIFEPFYRGCAATAAQIHGAGLGLFMVREALSSMGGSISVKSSPGKGSVFTIHLPSLPMSDNDSFPAARERHSENGI